MKADAFLPHRRAAAAALVAVLVAGCNTMPLETEGEWYDPTDWFEGGNIAYDGRNDYDYYDYVYNDFDYGYDWDFWDTSFDEYAWNDWDDYGIWGLDVWEENYYNEGYWRDDAWREEYPLLEDVGGRGRVFIYDILPLPPAGPSRLSGTIEGLQSVRLRRRSGATGWFTLAKVRLENGRTTVVNLGRQAQLEALDLKRGDTVKAIGHHGAIEGETVFIAQKLEAGGKRIEANPAMRLKGDARAGNQPRQEPRPEVTLQGAVARLERITPGETPAQHTLVHITLDRGRSAIVDLGPGASVERIGLDESDSITVRGHRARIEGREVIVAELLSIDGRRVRG